MKKVLSVLLVAMLFVACEGPEGPMGAQGPVGPKGEPGEGTNWYITSFTINENEWELVGEPNELNSYYVVDKPLKELTKRIYESGTVVAYIETVKGMKNGLPYVLHLGVEGNLGELLWTQTYDFDFYPGGVGFHVTYSDFETNIRPGTETFHVVVMW